MHKAFISYFMVCLIFCLMVFGPSPAWAVQPGEALTDPVLEARARAISAELRCPVCQNQSIDDSDAPLAGDLRKLIRIRLQAGDSNEEVLAYIVERYGEFTLLDPKFSAKNSFLWLAPLFFLLPGGFFLWRRLRAAKTIKD